MNSVLNSEKDIFVIPSDVFALLDPYHKVLAEVLQERGKVRILPEGST
jgi:hypothetical protein